MSDYETFEPFPKLHRLRRRCTITEKIDGTNAQIAIGVDGNIRAGSRNRYLTVESDNFGFAAWVRDNAEALIRLGPGRHFGEWWGAGIQRRYGMAEKRFSLFNTRRWLKPETKEWLDANVPCVSVVPVLYDGLFTTDAVDDTMAKLRETGSVAAPGFMNPEGVVVFQEAIGQGFKVTFEHDEAGKGDNR